MQLTELYSGMLYHPVGCIVKWRERHGVKVQHCEGHEREGGMHAPMTLVDMGGILLARARLHYCTFILIHKQQNKMTRPNQKSKSQSKIKWTIFASV